MDSSIIITISVVVPIVSVLIGISVGFGVYKWFTNQTRQANIKDAQQIIKQAQSQSQQKLIEARERSRQIERKGEDKVKGQLKNTERSFMKLSRREQELSTKEKNLKYQLDTLSTRRTKLDRLENQLDRKRKEQLEIFEKISDYTIEEAKEQLLETLTQDLELELARKEREMVKFAETQVEEKSRSIIIEAIQRLASSVVSESTVYSFPVEGDEVKGRLIGKEGRNIKAIQAATGVDMIMDDTPNTVVLSCFDPIRREVARVAIERLIKDGRIQPSRIESFVETAKRDVDVIMIDEAKKAVEKTGVKSVPPGLLPYIGRLKFRFSYGENVLQHSMEVGLISGLIAGEVGADIAKCKLAGFLHDIGKALTHEIEGPHAIIGADLLQKFNINSNTLTAVREHHDSDFTTVESFIVAAADAISAARPGSRKIDNDQFFERMTSLENLVNGFDEVQRCFAIQSGREVRVLVDPEVTDDKKSQILAQKIAKEIKEKITYAGQIKVVVVRELRAVDYAK